VTSIPANDGTYDAVFDFGIIHHIPSWRNAVAEVGRVLRSGGRFYAEEVFGDLITRSSVRRLLKHPQQDRFNHNQFRNALIEAGFKVTATSQVWGLGGWFIAERRAETDPSAAEELVDAG
jgi:SAM-dependent methyltransferase